MLLVAKPKTAVLSMTNVASGADGGPSSCYEQTLLNSILKISLQPYTIAEKIEEILSFLCSREELKLQNKGAVFFYDNVSEQLLVSASIGFSNRHKCRKKPAADCDCTSVANSGKSLFASGQSTTKTDNNCKNQPHYCIPILREQSTIGVMVLYTKPDCQGSQTNIQLFETVSHVIASIADFNQMEEQLYDVMRDLKLSLVALEEEKKFSDSIMHGMDHGLLVVNNEGYILRSNKAAKNILSPFTKKLDNHFLDDIFDKSTAKRLLTPTNEDTCQQDRMLQLVTDNGQEIHLTFSNVAHEDSKGDSLGRIISISDISELFAIRKEMEKMNRLATVAEIASAVAHEIRNPLAGIKIMAQSIEEDVVPGSEQHECSQRIIRQVDRLNKLLTEFFSYARPGIPNKAAISLPEVIEETKHLIKNKLIKNRINLQLQISSDLPPIFADQNQMQQVFLNLFLNSIDAIQQGGEIVITAQTITDATLKKFRGQIPHMTYTTDDIVVTFSDDGAGMDKAAIDKAFEPFYTTKSSGTGLGLSIVYRTLRENDAAIFLESKVRKGTKFTLFFKKGE